MHLTEQRNDYKEEKMKRYGKYFALFSLIYFIQGINGITSMPIFFYLKNDLGLSVQEMAYLGSVIGVAWIIKPLWAIIVDSVSIYHSNKKSYIIIGYIVIMSMMFYVALTGLTLNKYIAVSMIVSLALAFCDVSGDGWMIVVGQKNDICDKLQTFQWSAVSVASIIVGLVGGYLAKNYSYNVAYFIVGLFVMLAVIYVAFINKTEENYNKKAFNRKCMGGLREGFRNKQLWLSATFLLFLWFSPSFGIALNFKMVDVMGITKIQLGVIQSVGACGAIVGGIIFYIICKRISLKKLLYLSVLVSGATTFCFLYYPNIYIALLYAVIFGISGTICHLVVLTYCAKITPKNAESFFFSGLCSILNLGAMLSGLAGGYLYPIVGLDLLIIISGVFTLMCIVFIPFLKINGGLKNG